MYNQQDNSSSQYEMRNMQSLEPYDEEAALSLQRKARMPHSHHGTAQCVGPKLVLIMNYYPTRELQKVIQYRQGIPLYRGHISSPSRSTLYRNPEIRKICHLSLKYQRSPNTTRRSRIIFQVCYSSISFRRIARGSLRPPNLIGS